MTLNDPSLLDLLIDHELALKSLYQTLAVVFPDFKGFWRDLSGDEQAHADELEKLRSEPELDQWLALDGQLKSQAIKSSVEYVQSQTSRVQGGGVSLLQALAVAYDLESALIEKQFLVPSGLVCGEISAVLTVLNAKTEHHRQVIADALETEKRLRY